MMHHPVALMCDGYHVILIVERWKALTNKIVVYVNGKMRMSHTNYPDQIERFSFPSKRFVLSAKNRAEFKKEPKWMRKALVKRGYDPDETYTSYFPAWGSFKALKSHFIKHNISIELLKDWRFLAVDEG